MALMLAHGGAAGAAFEAAFLAVPVLVFGVMALIARRKRDTGDEGEEEELETDW
jgi:hypothetical protein